MTNITSSILLSLKDNEVGVSNADLLNLCNLECLYKGVYLLSLPGSWILGQMKAKPEIFFLYKITATVFASETFMKLSVIGLYFSLITQIGC